MVQSLQFSLEIVKEEARALVEKGVISRQQPIYTLCQYLPVREWPMIEAELERCDFMLRDRIADLLSGDCWDND